MSRTATVQLWRLVKAEYAASAFDGEGAFRFGGHWNSRGHRVVYASSSLSLALLEIVVHLDPAAPLPDLVALSIRVPLTDSTDFKAPTKRKEPMVFPWDIRQTREYGDRWLEKATSSIARIPSTIVPIEDNFLINPEHPKFKKYTISAPQPIRIDSRIR